MLSRHGVGVRVHALTLVVIFASRFRFMAADHTPPCAQYRTDEAGNGAMARPSDPFSTLHCDSTMTLHRQRHEPSARACGAFGRGRAARSARRSPSGRGRKPGTPVSARMALSSTQKTGFIRRRRRAQGRRQKAASLHQTTVYGEYIRIRFLFGAHLCQPRQPRLVLLHFLILCLPFSYTRNSVAGELQ